MLPAELNGDGLPDVVVSHWSALGGQVAHHRVMLGQPGGGFAAGQTFQTDHYFDHVADLDQDGNADLLLSRIGGLSTWMGQGDGTFQHLQDLTLGLTSSAIDTTDFDGDGNLDVVAFHVSFADAVLVRGAGDGTLATMSGVSLGPNFVGGLTDGRVVDLDGDGGVDLATCADVEFVNPTGQALSTARNVTYAAGGPLTDWGGARRGTNSYPTQIVTGTLGAGTPVLFELEMARLNASAWMVIGFEAIFAPFKGGVIVPQPDLVLGPLPTGPTGSVDLGGTWPAGLPAGLTLDVQFWIADPLGWKSLAASGSAHLVQP
jgi:hypothetical protein